MTETTETISESKDGNVRLQDSALRWHVGFRQTPSTIPIGKVEVEIRPVSTPDGPYIVRRLLLLPKLRHHKVVEIQAEVYPLRKFQEILKAESKRLTYFKEEQDACEEARHEIGSCKNSLNRIYWLLQSEEKENPKITEQIQICKNDLDILTGFIEEVEKP